jgi:autotransporter-associated beta strand protein
MNHIYRLVWNKKRHMLMAVAEVGGSQGKEAGGTTAAADIVADATAFPGVRTLVAAALCAIFPLAAFAQSGDHTIVAGNTEYVHDGDGSNAEAAAWNLHNDGQFDISDTDAGTALQSLSGSGTVLLGERTLTLTAAQGFYQGTLVGSGGLAIGAGSEILGGANNYLGATAIGSEATLALSGSGSIALSSGLLNAGVFDISATNNGASLQTLSGSGFVQLGGQVLTLSNASTVFDGIVSGSGGLALAAGMQGLSGTNTYTGATVIGSAGTLALSGSGSIALSSLNNDGVFDIGAANQPVQVRSLAGSGTVFLGGQSLTLSNAGDTYAGTIDGNGGLAVAGGTQVLSGANSYTGATTIGADGTLALSGSGSIALSSGVAANGVFDIAATDKGAQIGTLSGSGAVLLGGQTLTLAQAESEFAGTIHGSGGLAIAGGYEVLSGANTYTGATTVAQGAMLVLTGAGSIAQSSGVQADGYVDVSGVDQGPQLTSLSGSGSVWLGSQDLTLTQASGTFAGNIDGDGGVAVAGGTQTLSGANTYTGATVIGTEGTLVLSGSGAIALSSGLVNGGVFDIAATNHGAQVQTLSGSGTVLLGGQTLTLAQAADVFSGTIRGSGGVAIAAGTETLTGVNTYSGTTAVAGGAVLALADDGRIGNSRVQLDGTLDIMASNGNAAVKSLAGSGAVLLGGQSLTLTHAGDTFAGHLLGSGGIVVAGGVQTLSSAQEYTGASVIRSGATLALSGSGAIALSSGVQADGTLDIAAANRTVQVSTLSGSGSVNLGGQTLTLNAAQDTFSGVIRGSGGLAIAAGTEVLSGRNTYSGSTAVAQDATLALAGNGSIGASRVQLDGTLDITASNGAAAVKGLGGSGSVLLGGQTLTITGAADSFAGTISGSGGIAVTGGVQTLTAAQGYTGATTIGSGATLALAGAGSIANSARVTANGSFDISGTGATIKSLAGSGRVILGAQTLNLSGAADTFAGAIDGSGALNLARGTQTLAGNNGYTGATNIGSGATLALSGAGSIASSSSVAVGGTLDIGATTRGATLRNVSGAGQVVLGTQTLTLTAARGSFDGVISGSGGLNVAGGNATLTAANGYSGSTTIASGATLALTGNGSIGASAVRADGRFDIAAAARDVSVKSLSGSGAVLLGSHALTLTQAAGSFDGVIQGSGNLNVAGGTLLLGGSNTFSGKTVVSNATLRTLSAAAFGTGTSALELNDGTWQAGADLTHARGLQLTGRGTVDVDGGTTTTETGTVAGSGALRKQGTGTLVLNGVLANSGGVQVNQGTLALTATNTFSGGVAVGSGGLLRIDSDANLGAATNALTLDGGTLQTTGTMTSARAVAITDKTGTIDTLGADSVVTLNGNVDGAGRIVKEGEGTLVLAGDNGGGKGSANQYGDGWTGGLTINAGLVEVTNAYGLGWGSVLTFNAGKILATVDIATGQDIRMGRSTGIDTAAGTTTTLSGDLITTDSGDGCFNKTGLGTLNVTGAAHIASTCVLEGKLLANGTFASRVTVAHGATLGGAGTIQGDVLVQGTLSPGNSPGMLTADSAIVMAAGSTYKEDIGGTQQATATTPVGAAGYYSYLHVVGGKQFTIQPGSTLAPTLKNLYSADEAGYGSKALVPALGQNFRFVTADGGIVGRFDTLVQPDGMEANTRFAAFYNQGGSNSIELKVLPASYATWFKDANANSRAVAGALDGIAAKDSTGTASAAQTGLLYAAGSYTTQTLGGLVKGLAGETHGALAAALPQAGWELQRTILKHAAANDGRALWLDIGAGRAKWSADSAASGFDADRVQVSAGLDVLQAPGLRLGFGASHASTDVDADGGSGKLRQNKVFVYGEKAVGGLTFDALGSYGRDQTDSQRNDPFAPASRLGASADGHGTLLGAGVRMARDWNGATVEPFARVTVQKIERDGSTESSGSAAALTVDGWSATGTRMVAGLSGASRNSDPLQASTWRFNLGAGVDAGDLLRPQQHAVLAGSSIAIGAPDVSRAFVQGGLTGTLQLKKGAYIFLGVTGEARSSYYTLGGNAGVRAVF